MTRIARLLQRLTSSDDPIEAALLASMHETARRRPEAHPRWLRRRLEPASAWWRNDDAGITSNTGDRSWTRLAVSGSAPAALVDPSGAIWPGGNWPAVNFWIGVAGQWRSPSAQPSVRQELSNGAPVVSTRVRAPGGEVVQRAWAVPGRSGRALVVVEIENLTGTQIGVALGLDPHSLVGHRSTGRVTATPETLSTDIGELVRLGRPASAVAVGDGVAELLDRLDELTDTSRTTPPSDDPVTCDSSLGLASGALVVPLGTGGMIRAVIDPSGGQNARPPEDLGDAEAVVRGWEAQADREARWDLPESQLADASTAARRHLLAGVGDSDLLDLATTGTPEGVDDPVRSAARRLTLVPLAARLGWEAEVADQVAGWAERPVHSGARGALDAVAELGGWASLIQVGRAEMARELLDLVVNALARVDRGIARLDHPSLEDPALRWWWSQRGAEALLSVGASLATLGEGAASNDMARLVERWQEALAPDFDGQALEISGDAVVVRRGSHAGLHLALTAAAARAELTLDPAAAEAKIGLLMRLGSPTWTWPTVVDPTNLTGIGSADGHDLWVSAEIVGLVLDILLRSDGDRDVELLRFWPAEWDGQGIEAHDLSVGDARVSYAVRWHGERPALLWQSTDGEGLGPRLTTPALDPEFATSERAGEALLAAPHRPVEPDPANDADEVPVRLTLRAAKPLTDAATTESGSAGTEAASTETGTDSTETGSSGADGPGSFS